MRVDNMRDPERIPKICKKFEEMWSKYPDLRFGQFVYALYYKASHVRKEDGSIDFFYVEDDEFERILDEFLRDWKNDIS